MYWITQAAMSGTLDEWIKELVIRRVVTDNRHTVSDWKIGKPGAWGFLAGQAVIGIRIQLNRQLTDIERREVWQDLWDFLVHFNDCKPDLAK